MKATLVFLLTLAISYSQAQDNTLYKRTNIKLGHSTTPQYMNPLKDLALGNFRLEANRGISRFVELGGYLGYSRFGNVQYQEEFDPADNTTWDADYIYSDAYSYGITANFHIFPLLKTSAEPRFDIYLSVKLGGLSIVAPERSVYKGNGLDYGLYGGLSYYITRSWGVFAEIGRAHV